MAEPAGANPRSRGDRLRLRPRLRAVSKRLALGCLLLLPALGFWTWVHLVHPRPHWVHFYDPETIYFYQGLRLLEGRAPTNVDNPGTPVQVASALLAALTTRSPLELDGFRGAAYLAIGALALVSLLPLLPPGRNAWPLSAVAIAAWSYWITPGALEYSSVWSPEALAFPLTMAFATAAARWNRAARGSALLLGGVVGLALAVKLTFLSWAFAAGLCLLALPNPGSGRIRDLARYALGITAGFGLATSAAAARYPELFARFGALIAGAHPHSGQPDVASSSSLVSGAGRTVAVIVGKASAWTLLLTAALALAGVALLRHRSASGQPNARRAIARALLFSGALIAGHAASLARGMETHYLVPLGVALPLLAAALATASHAVPRRVAIKVLAVAVLLLATRQVALDIGVHERRLAGSLAARDAIAGTIASRWRGPDPPVVVHGFRSPDPAAALRFFADDPRRLRLIEAAYPTTGHVDWSGAAVLPVGAECWDFLVALAGTRAEVALPAGRRIASVSGFDVFERAVAAMPSDGAPESRSDDRISPCRAPR